MLKVQLQPLVANFIYSEGLRQGTFIKRKFDYREFEGWFIQSIHTFMYFLYGCKILTARYRLLLQRSQVRLLSFFCPPP